MVLAGEERLALEHLSENAAGTPDVDLYVVLLPSEHNLRGTIVSGRDVTGHLGILNACQTEVADLKIAVLVDQDIARLQIAVHNAGGVDVLKATHDLVKKVLDELLLEGPGGEQTVQVSTEQLGNEVDILQW